MAAAVTELLRLFHLLLLYKPAAIVKLHKFISKSVLRSDILKCRDVDVYLVNCGFLLTRYALRFYLSSGENEDTDRESIETVIVTHGT